MHVMGFEQYSDQQLEQWMGLFYESSTILHIDMARAGMLTLPAGRLADMAAAGDELCRAWLECVELARQMNVECSRRGYTSHEVRLPGQALH